MGVETSSIAANVEATLGRIQRAAQRSGRNAEEITVVAVAKTFPAESIRAAYAAGVRHFGENRVQEWEAKRTLLADLNAAWHLVGHLQTNKAARAARLFHRVDSLDSIELAKKLDLTVASLRVRLLVLIEVHLSDEPSKSGISEADLPALAEAALALPHLDLRGLMCVPPYFEDTEQVRPFFRRLRELRDTLRQHLRPHHPEPFGSAQGKLREGPQPETTGGFLLRGEESLLPELSMGMSHDFEVAIEEGATQVRLGTAIFGSRPQP